MLAQYPCGDRHREKTMNISFHLRHNSVRAEHIDIVTKKQGQIALFVHTLVIIYKCVLYLLLYNNSILYFNMKLCLPIVLRDK